MKFYFLNKYINLILDSNDINKNFKKIMLIYDIMNGKNINVIKDNEDDRTKSKIKILTIATKSRLKLKSSKMM